MHANPQPVSIAILIGGTAGVLISAALFVVLPWREAGAPYPFWAHLLSNIGDGCIAVCPGLVSGYLARRSGLGVGALAGLMTIVAVAAASSATSWPAVFESREITIYFLGNLASATVAAVITNSVAGIAGEYLAKRVQPV